tara:strand:- start:2112 stop:2987 length:876 start_codon:yes stop_codon:yes gene_type:complete
MSKENLFPFDYIEKKLLNLDGSESNFRQVYGLAGENIACPKSSYNMVKTADLSNLGWAFIDKGHEVTTFDHRNGEVIGLNVEFGDKPSKVGESNYHLFITVPNNGTGKGFLSIMQTRLVCSNGMVSSKTVHKDNQIKIPHTINYNQSIELMKQSIDGFMSLFGQVQLKDEALDGRKLELTEIQYHLNKWFFEQELPKSQICNWTLDSFRKAVALGDEIPSATRYAELNAALNREWEYNKELGLKPSMYTAYATITNYLSRRVEVSGSRASNEVKLSRASEKLIYFDELVTV